MKEAVSEGGSKERVKNSGAMEAFFVICLLLCLSGLELQSEKFFYYFSIQFSAF